MVSQIVRSRRGAAVSRSALATCEQLETRRLLSTINWTNRGVSDNFGIYGGNTAVARAIVDRAINDWERVIVDFNFSGGGNTYSVDITAGPISGRGAASIQTSLVGKPTSANISMDDNGGGEGWYFDPVIGTAMVPDDSEFTNLQTPFNSTFTGVGAAADDDDFYRTIAHELGHAMGISGGNSLLLDDNFTDIGADPIDGVSRLLAWNINGGAVEATFTTNTGTHLYEGPTILAGGTSHPNDLMNPGRTVGAPPTERQLISDLTATILRDAYSYTVALPSTINTFYANLNTSTNVVTVTGDADPTDATDADAIDLELTGTNTGDLRVDMNGTMEVIQDAQYTSIIVNALTGNDDIDVDELASGKTVTVNGGDDNDNINVAQEFDDIDTNLGSNVVVNGGFGTDTIVLSDGADSAGGDDYTINQNTFVKNAAFINRTITYNTMEQFTLTGGPNAGIYDILTTFSTVNYNITGGAAADVFTVGAGDAFFNVDADVTLNGGGGADDLIVLDSTRAIASTYTVGTGTIDRTGAVGSVTFSAIEDATLTTGTLGDTVQVNGVLTGVTFRLNTGSGADSISLGTDLDSDFNGVFIGNGGAGTDSITFNDGGDPLDDTYTITGSSINKAPLAISVTHSLFEDITLNANPDNNIINFSSVGSTQTMRLNGGAGDDTFSNTVQDLNNSIVGNVIISGGAGTGDAVTLNDSGDATAGAYTLTSNTFQVTAGLLSGLITYSTVESFAVTTNDQPTPININSALSTVSYTVNGGDGNDTFNIGAGDFDNNIDSIVSVVGGAGTDRINIDDSLDTVDDTYNITGSSFAKNSGTGGVSYFGGLFLPPAVELFALDASEANNTINLNGLGSTGLAVFPNPPTEFPMNITLNGNGGNDAINVATLNGVLAALKGNVSIVGGAGTDSLTVDDSSDSSADTFALTNVGLTNSNWNFGLTYANTLENFTVEGGTGGNIFSNTSTFGGTTYRLNGNNGIDNFDIIGNNVPVIVDGGAGLDVVNVNPDAVGTATARFVNNQDLQSLNIFVGGLLNLDAGDHVIDTVGATFNGRMNLADGGFIDRAPANQATYRTLLTTGYAAGAWTTVAQPAIFSSMAAGAALNDALGYGFGAELGLATLFGVPVAGGDHVIRYTLYGDANLSGNVDLDDFTRLAAAFGLAGNWSRGNSNYDANVNLDDFTALAANFGLSAPAGLPRASAAPSGSPFSQKPIGEESLVEREELVA